MAGSLQPLFKLKHPFGATFPYDYIYRPEAYPLANDTVMVAKALTKTVDQFNAGVLMVGNELRSSKLNIKRLALAEMCHVPSVKLGVAEQGNQNITKSTLG